MSFSNEIKHEILSARPAKPRLKEAQAYGLFAFAREFSPDKVALHTENEQIADLYRDYLRDFAPRGAGIETAARALRGRMMYSVSLTGERERRALFTRITGTPDLARRFEGPGEAAAFLSGVFLACGNATDPEKSYHLEFLVREQPLAEMLFELLESAVRGARHSRRRGASVIYYKECTQIEDLLTLMGASKCSLAMIEVEIIKQVRNRAMRAANCETANIDKTVRASALQTEDIELILRAHGLESLPEPLREAALIRLENPELSLRELAKAFNPPLTRSGVHHRLDKLSKIAVSIREDSGPHFY